MMFIKAKKSITNIAAAFAFFGFNASAALAQTTPLGTEVVNRASLSYDHSSGNYTFPTNDATFTVTARPSPSVIEFFRQAPTAPDAEFISLNGSDYSFDGTNTRGSFQPIPRDSASMGMPVSSDKPVPIIPAESFFAGEMMIVRVVDKGQNGDPDLIETVTSTITTKSGDSIVIRLYEDTPDSGIFYAYVPSTSENSTTNDPVLSTPDATSIKAEYVDPFDATEQSEDSVLVDPYGLLFDSLTGELINGAEVTIVDADTLQPTQVFGIDAMSAYPSTLLTGSVVTDASGLVYDLEDGQFLFPLVYPGEYRLLITPPQGYIFPSGFGASDFEALNNGPFEIIDGSYGLTFTVDASGPLHFDVPLDTTRGLTVTKTAGNVQAALGDFVTYTIKVSNDSEHLLPLLIKDELPRGVRYQDNSAQMGGERLPEDAVTASADLIIFDAGDIQAGQSKEINYVAAIGAGAPNGEAINIASAINPYGRKISNTSEAVINIKEDLLRSESTVIGRVSENACNTDDEWTRDIQTTPGVEGVRIYMETGEFVVTDETGAFHFEGIEKGTHILQIDPATLPAGYTPIQCEENTRYAGNAASQFIDIIGGGIWKANFYLERTETVATEETQSQTVAAQEYLAYDDAWLNTQNADTAWVYPDTSFAPAGRSLNIGIKLPAGSKIDLNLNGRPVEKTNRQPRLLSADQKVVLKRWKGVDIQSGRNTIEAIITHKDGRVEKLNKEIWFVEQGERARLVDDQSILVADGRTAPIIAIRLENSEKQPVHAGRIIEVDVTAPYKLNTENRLSDIAPVDVGIVEARGISINREGIAMVELAPTLRTGKVRVRVPLTDDRYEEIEAYLRPEKRDWVVVGLAVGELAEVSSNDIFADTTDGQSKSGRIAFFAKGLVKGDWLLTLAVDTAKRRGRKDDELYDAIDPNAYYTLYGDRSESGHEAQSRYPLYVKLEKDTTKVLFGDFNTDIADSELGRYGRQLSGLKADYEGENFSLTGFAAETNQGFVKDEIPADGTSGPYQLSQTNLVRNSETIIIETRDRNRPDQILSSRSLQRYTDYELDVDTGEIIFRFPVNTTDASFNDNVIVVDYETFADADRNITYGGRAEVRGFDDKVEVGVNFISEDGASTTSKSASRLTSVDAKMDITEKTQLVAEFASSNNASAEEGQDDVESNAYLIELRHASDGVSAQAYIREEEAGFGLGQTGSNTNGIRRVGAQASIRISEKTNEETGNRLIRRVEGQAYRETNLGTDQNRTVSDIALIQNGHSFTAGVGLRSVKEHLTTGDRESLLATVNASKNFQKAGVTVLASHEQPISSDKDQVSTSPERTILGLDKAFGERVTLNLRHEITNGADASGNNTLVGVTVQPWTGGQVVTGLDRITKDASSRLAATVGLDQSFRISENWSASLGLMNRSRIDGGDNPVDPLADDAISPIAEGTRSALTEDDSYTSGYVGLGYRNEGTAASGRFEYRDTISSTRTAFILGAAREMTETISYAASARLQSDEQANGTTDKLIARLGFVRRPEDESISIFNRLDFQMERADLNGESWKVVNNLGINMAPTERSQLAAFHGIKYSEANLLGQQYSGWTNLIGAEYRYDVTRYVDLGLRGSVLTSTATSTTEYQFGPSVGLSPTKNIWISAGYNFTGFKDNDFDAALDSRNGMFIKLRLKLDQNDLDGLLAWVSPKEGK
ncbi:hypothetical protein [Hirschia litorea]|uniref:DUF11 domain-containing protein n=1 Tax=Hirschia litorea TaxID=1199156 RepID=A0ABW2IPD9_9PROT